MELYMKGLSRIVVLAAMAILTACGGGGSGESASSSVPVVESSGPAIDGQVMKGIIHKALVEAYVIDHIDGVSSTPIAEAITDESGSFFFELPDEFASAPLYLKMSSMSDSEMRCDIYPHCDVDGSPDSDDDRYAFGSWVPIPENFQMTAVMISSDGTLKGTISPLSHIAANLFLNDSYANRFELENKIREANSRVADRFGLARDITQIVAHDITDTESVARVSVRDDIALKFAAINSALISAVQDDSYASGSSANLFASLDKFADFFQLYGVPDNAESDHVTGMNEIYTQAAELVRRVSIHVQLSDDLSPNLIVAIADAFGDFNFAAALADSQEPADFGSIGVPSDSNLIEGVEKIKGFVEEVRELGVAIDSSIIEDPEGNQLQSVGYVLDGFEFQLDAASMMSSEDAEYAYKAIMKSLEAILKTYEMGNPDLAELTIPAGSTEIVDERDQSIITVNVTVDEEGARTFSVNDDVTVRRKDIPRTLPVDVSVQLNALALVEQSFESGDITIFDDPNDQADKVNNETHHGVIDMALQGSIVSNTVELTLSESFVHAFYWGNVREEIAVHTYSDEYSFEHILLHQSDWTISELDAQLNASVSQIESEDIPDPLTFVGQIDLSLRDFVISKEKSNGFYKEVVEYEGQEYLHDMYFNHVYVEEFSEATLSLMGSAGNQSGENFLLGLDISLDDSNLSDWAILLDKCHKSYSCYYESDEVYFGGDDNNNEFLGISADLRFSANLSGVSDVVVVDFSFDTTSQFFADIALNLSYPGHWIKLHGSIEYDFLLFPSRYEDTYYIGDLYLEKPAEGIQIKLGIDTSVDPGEEEISVEMRLDSNRDGVTDERDFLYGWYEQRNGVDLLIYADESNPDKLELESLF